MLSENTVKKARRIFTDTIKSVEFLSYSIKIDFIAYHELQAQAAKSLFCEMERHFECNWEIGPDRKYTGAEAAIMLDHVWFHPKVLKSSGYKYLFYLSHDLADFNVYEAEKEYLKEYDIIFVPGPVHYQYAAKALGKNTLILEIGWPKYDYIEFPADEIQLRNKIQILSHKPTILYAPTWAHTYEWKYLLPLLKNLPCNIIVKNHIYVNKGQELPKGQEEIYKSALASVKEMENEIFSYSLPNMLVAPSNMNICSLFPYVDILISDQSSVLLEFLPFGISIETGRYNENENDCKPEVSHLIKEVLFLKKDELCNLLSSVSNIEKLINTKESDNKKSCFDYVNRNIHSGKLTAYLIDRYIYKVQRYKKYEVLRLIYKRIFRLIFGLKRRIISIIKR